jgi:plasmid stability protein
MLAQAIDLPFDLARVGASHLIAVCPASAIMCTVRQLITRIDDRLHRRLKDRAAVEGRSMNALVTELLSTAVSGSDERAHLRSRMGTAGLQVVPRPARRPPSRKAAIASTRGAGRSASEALAAERRRR